MPRNFWIHFGAFIFFLSAPHLLYSFLFTTPIGNDFPIAQPYPLLRFLAYLQEDCFILWDSELFGGISASYGWGLNQALFPITWLYCLFPETYQGQLLPIFLHFKLISMGFAGYFAFLFFLEISRTWIGAGFGGLVFLFNFRMLDNLRFGPPVEVLALLPLVLWLLEKMRIQGRFCWGVFYSFALSAMFLAGYSQHGVYNVLLLVSYMVFRETFFKKMNTSFWRHYWERKKQWLCFSCFSGFAFFLASPLLLTIQKDLAPFYYQRTRADFSWTDTHKMGGASLFTNFCFPWLADVHSGFYSAMGASLFFAFACVALYKEKLPQETRRFLLFFLSFFLFTLLYALGSPYYVSTWVQTLVPPLKFTRVHGRIMGTGVFCFAAMTVFFIQWIETLLIQRQKPSFSFFKTGITIVGGILFLFVLVIGISIITCFYWNLYDILQLKTFSEIANRFLFILPLLFDNYTPVFIAATPQMILTQLFAFMLFSGLTLLCLSKILSENRTLHYLSYLGLVILLLLETHFYHRKGSWILPHYPRFASTIEFLRLDTYHHRIHPAHTFFYEPSLISTINKDGTFNFNAPRTLLEFMYYGGKSADTLYKDLRQGKLFVPQEYAVVSEVKRALQGNDLRKKCILEAQEAEKWNLKEFFKEINSTQENTNIRWTHHSPQTDLKSQIQVKCYTPNEIQFQIQTKSPVIVNYLDLYHPNFVAEIDGKPTAVLRTYGVFKGVMVPEGVHEVRIRYYPKTFFRLIRLALMTFVILTGILFFSFLKFCFPSQKQWLRWVLFLTLSFGTAIFGFYAEKTIHQLAYPAKQIQYSPP